MIGIEILQKTISVAKAILGAESVGEERMRKRLEVCAECESVRTNERGEMKCGVCGCRLRGDRSLINLARYEEPGCKARGGSRWQAAGV